MRSTMVPVAGVGGGLGRAAVVRVAGPPVVASTGPTVIAASGGVATGG
ncbi:hypothetical protein [Nocardia ignorata]|nr:hypothetical protein [Nocardia ignorata]